MQDIEFKQNLILTYVDQSFFKCAYRKWAGFYSWPKFN